MTADDETWCAGSGPLPVAGTLPKNQHTRCNICGRIVSIIAGKLRKHYRNKVLKTYHMDRRVRKNNAGNNATTGEYDERTNVR